jgi:basic membrane protein A
MNRAHSRHPITRRSALEHWGSQYWPSGPALIVVALLLSMLLIFPGCGQKKEEGGESRLQVGLVFDVGGKGDKSFNDAAYRGLTQAARDFPVEFVEFEPGEDADRESGLRKLARGGYDVVIGVGFLFTDAITKVARDFPQVHFAAVDYDLKPGMEIPENLVALKFREEEGSFLVGALAAMKTSTGTVGFIGGMDIPLIHKFEAGYIHGARTQDPEIEVLVNYAGATGKAFDDPVKGQELALAQFNRGADIIFQAAGTTGLGVKEAALQKGGLVIWVDSNGNYLAPGTILTSMVKKVDVAVYETIAAVHEGRFEGGVQEFGLAEDGVGYAVDEHNRELISDEMIARLEELKADIIAGKIEVPKE